MRVFFASYQAVSILHGGPHTAIRNTVSHLNRMGVEARLFDPWSKFRKQDCDIFHVLAANIGTYHISREIHTLGVPLAVSPIVYSRHSPTYIRSALAANRLLQKTGRGVWSDYILCSDICHWASKVMPNTKDEAALVSRGLGIPEGKIVVVPNGVDERFASADPGLFKKKFGLEKFILNVGHTGHGRKNVLRLIRALATIDHPAVIIGRVIRGAYGDMCVREAAKNKNILLLDGLENDSELLASAYAACDVFVLPSLFETPGIAALEAGLAGAKVVVTKYGGTAEYFGDMATYVNPYSVSSIHAGILAGLERTKNDALRQHIGGTYLWQHVAEKTAAVYRSMLDISA